MTIYCATQHQFFQNVTKRLANFYARRSLIEVRRSSRASLGELNMAWKAPKIVEVPVGMEINMYACAARK
jgi:coenzyme PQQ precursor peptide PqqA